MAMNRERTLFNSPLVLGLLFKCTINRLIYMQKLDTVEQFLSEKIESVLERYGFISRHVPSQKRKASENPSPTKRGLERPFKRLKSSDKLPHQGLIIRGTNIGKQQVIELFIANFRGTMFSLYFLAC